MKKIAFVFLIFILLVSSSCAFLNKESDINYYYSIDDYIEGFYFPERIGIDERINEWYSKMLNVLEEPVIFIQDDPNRTIYRFTYHRTWHNLLSIRIEIDEQEEAAVLFFKINDRHGMELGFPGDLEISKQRALERSEIENLIEAIKKYDYWAMPFDEIKDNWSGRDGSMWIIELLKDGKYNAISRWSPTSKESFQYCDEFPNGRTISLNRISDLDAVYELGRFFIELSGYEIEELY